MLDDLDPKDFEDTAAAVVAACTDVEGARRATLLAEAGLLGVIAPEAVGGLDLPMRFAVPVVSAAGAGLLGYPLIETLLLARALSRHDPDCATQICAGTLRVTIAWCGRAEDGIVGQAPMGAEVDRVLVFQADGTAKLIASKAQADAAPWDVDAPVATVDCRGAQDGPLLDAATVAMLHAEADILRSAFIIGSAQACLSQAASYAQERVQFGRPLSAYQALRHRLSRDALAVETLRSALTRALATTDDFAREALWLNAGRAGPLVAESAIQVFGGMGFTWDVPLHRHLRQMQAQAAYGAATDRLDALGDDLIQTAHNPWYEEATHVA